MEIWNLPWSQVDPALHPFETGGLVAALAEHLVGTFGLGKPLPRREGGAFEHAVDAFLHARFGVWSIGWRFSMGEGSNGGVVTAWCCIPHSLPKQLKNEAAAMALATKIVEALGQWRAHLVALAGLFRKVERRCDTAALQRAVLEVLALVMDATDCEDAWYGHATQSAAWLFESLGASRESASKLANEAFSGRFQSWAAPPEDTLEAAVAQAVRTFECTQ